MITISEIQGAIVNQEWEIAKKTLDLYLENNEYDDTCAILKASILSGLGLKDEQWDTIQKGLKSNPINYELYVLLGDYYLETNLYQSYLCYENALFFCDNPIDREQISSLLSTLKKEYYIEVPKTAIILLSYNTLDYTKLCIESIRQNTLETTREIIVIDNASTDGSLEWLRCQKDIKLIENPETKGFPNGYNQGIAVAEKDSDIFLLNSDNILPMNALFWLKMGLYESDDIGSTGSVSNYAPSYCTNFQTITCNTTNIEDILRFAITNNTPIRHPYEDKLFLLRFALLIKRAVLSEVGPLDEMFSPGFFEDIDYGLRIIKSGYKNILCKNSFVLHFGNKSIDSILKNTSEIITRNQLILNKKWGLNLQYYMSPRLDLINLIQENTDKPLNILEIGCGCGATMAKIKNYYPFATTYGIEIVDTAAQLANIFGDVVCDDVENMTFSYKEEYFDYCIMGDVLEHLREPKFVLQRLKKYIKRGGKIILSMPNMKHWSVIVPLLTKDIFPYANSGLLDTTHLKMYTCSEIQKLIINSGYELDYMSYTTAGTPTEKELQIINDLVKYMENPDLSTFMAYQYIVVATAV